MLIVLPVCAKDLALTKLNLQLAAKLDARCPFPALISAPTGIDIAELESLASKWFASISTFRYSDWKGDRTWPRPQNWAWQETARHVATLKPEQPWFWWEADATPLKTGWFSAIADGYIKGKLPFAGHIVVGLGNGHLNGVAVYPPDVRKFSANAFITRASPFDRVLSQDAIRHVHPINHLIGHYLKPKGRPSFVASPKTVDEPLKSEMVIFHGCSDGSLAQALLENYPSLLTRFKRAVNFVAPKPRPLIPLICHMDSSSGYGIYSAQIAMEFLRRGYRVEIKSPSWNENGSPLPVELKNCMLTTPRKHDWELAIYPCVIQPKGLVMDNPNTAYFTMWESTRLISKCDPSRTQAVNTLNRCKVVMVPNAWNASVFSSCGVDTPIRLAPLGTDMSLFPFHANDTEANPFVFGTAARTHFGGIRKGFNLVVAAFQLAFPTDLNVRLKVKCFAEDPPLETKGDKRIEQIRTFLPAAKLADWYRSIHVFVSGSASEGWGKHQQEAMCMGRPVIGIAFGGVCEFFNEENGYACDWKLEPGEGIYKTMGHYAKPTVEGLAKQMLDAYQNRKEVKRKGILAAKSASRFTIANSADKIIEVLKEFKLLDPL